MTRPLLWSYMMGAALAPSVSRLCLSCFVNRTFRILLTPISTAKMSHMPDVEKDHAGNDSINGNYKYDLHHDHHDEDTALRRLRTAGSLTITPELFEKIYLSPKNQVSNNIRSTFGNPTPLCVLSLPFPAAETDLLQSYCRLPAFSHSSLERFARMARLWWPRCG